MSRNSQPYKGNKTKSYKLPALSNKANALYLKRKHIGGISNAKGNAYENLYLLYKVLISIGQFIDKSVNTVFSTQVEDCAVDDLVIIEENEFITYHQLKDTKGLKWTQSNKKHTLLDDFLLQEQISTRRKENFLLKIVTSDPKCDVLTMPKPKSLQHTRPEFFPSRCLYEHLKLTKDFSNNIAKISPAYTSIGIQDVLCKNIIGFYSTIVSGSFTTQDVLMHIRQSRLMFSTMTIDSKEMLERILYESLKTFKLKELEYSYHSTTLEVLYKYQNDATLEFNCEITESVAQLMESRGILQGQKYRLLEK